MLTRISHLILTLLALFGLFVLFTVLEERLNINADPVTPVDARDETAALPPPPQAEATQGLEILHIAPPVEATQVIEIVPTAPPTVASTPVVIAPPPTPQPTLDPGLSPFAGSVSLAAGFTPDPYTATLIAGGDLFVPDMAVVDYCPGYANAAPHYRLTWSGFSDALNIYFDAGASGGDATLIIRDPWGNWHCNDDFAGVDPALTITDPMIGQYDIWVGRFSRYDEASGTLYITEYDLTTLPPQRALNPDLEPEFFSDTLTEDNNGDYILYPVISGGPVNIRTQKIGRCVGYTGQAPDFELESQGYNPQMRIFFDPHVSGHDTTLAILDPSGAWHCSDDADGLDPAITFDNPIEGLYRIWVGSYNEGDTIEGELGIFDVVTSPSPEETVQLDHTLEPLYGSTSLFASFLPDPHTAPMVGQGPIDVHSQPLGIICRGYTTVAPSYSLQWTGLSDDFTIHFEAADGGDATIVIRDPDGNWHCDDDFIGLDPGIVFNNPIEGQYDIWVGSFGSQNAVNGTLHITEYTVSP